MPIQPRGKVERSNIPTSAYARIGEPQFEIVAWCPDEDAQMPPEQVHFIIHLPAILEAPPMVLRFKSPDTLGFFIEELIRYRREVWKNSELVTGEQGSGLAGPSTEDDAGDIPIAPV